MAAMNDSDVQLVVKTLVDFGVISEEGCRKFAEAIRNLQAFSGGAPATRGRRGRGAGRKPRAKFEVSKEELVKLRQEGMTAKTIAEKHGVSMATVNLRLREHGLTKPRGEGAKKKKVGK